MLVTPNIADKSQTLSLEEWLSNPPERQEWVNGKLIEKQGMTAKHGKVQARLAAYWINYKNDIYILSEILLKHKLFYQVLQLA